MRCIKADRPQIGVCDQGLPSSICGQNMRPEGSSLGTFHLVSGLFATTVVQIVFFHDKLIVKYKDSITIVARFFLLTPNSNCCRLSIFCQYLLFSLMKSYEIEF